MRKGRLVFKCKSHENQGEGRNEDVLCFQCYLLRMPGSQRGLVLGKGVKFGFLSRPFHVPTPHFLTLGGVARPGPEAAKCGLLGRPRCAKPWALPWIWS